ncbi:unnamed protein product [Rodentolepis nana]|uniref:Bacteriophage protein n=1 Tax=Rodentolepis nana TaxID=102285 RepID=A0A0R3TMB5_RODNA|nr:unnamed protein product [Rodentolepis nana]
MLEAIGSESQTRLTANVALNRPVPEGTEVTLICSTDTSNGDGSGALRILRRRSGGGGIDGFEDLANFATKIVQISPDKPDIAATFTVSRQDDGAVFICGDVETLGFQSQNPTATVIIGVQCKFI